MTEQPVEPKKETPAAETAPAPEAATAKAPEATTPEAAAPAAVETTPVVEEAKPKAPLVQSKNQLPKRGFLSRAFDGAVYYTVNWPIKMALKAVWEGNKKVLSLSKDFTLAGKNWRSKIGRALVATSLAASVFAAEAVATLYTLGYAAIEAGEVVPYSERSNSGLVQGIGDKGGSWPCKSWEGRIAMDTYAPNAKGQLTNQFEFTVRQFRLWPFSPKPELITQLEQLQNQGKKIDFVYKQSQIDPLMFDENPESFVERVLSCVQKSAYTIKPGSVRVIEGATQAPPKPAFGP